ncbi:hypothetical protein [Aquibacillus kalidii]|nr:hypothetical protein [Aquibacillus kalidii]
MAKKNIKWIFNGLSLDEIIEEADLYVKNKNIVASFGEDFDVNDHF